MLFSANPEPQGLYDPKNETDSGGVAMVVDVKAADHMPSSPTD